MKRSVKIFGAVAGMASLLVSCQKKEIVDNTPVAETVEISITAEVDEDTKTHLEGNQVKWDADEKLAVIEVATNKKGVTTLTYNDSSEGSINNEGKISFPIKFTGLPNLEKVYYYSIYPNTAMSSYTTDDINSLTSITINLDPEQKPTATSFGPKADLLVARPKCFAAQTSNITFNFARVIAVGKMKIKDLEYPTEEEYTNFVGEPIHKVTIVTDGAKISGKSTFGFKGISIDVPAEFGDSNEIVLDYDEGLVYTAQNGAYAYFTAWPGDVTGTLTITVETEHFTFKREIALSKVLTFKTAEFTSFQVSFKDIKPSVKDFENVLPKDTEDNYIKDLTIGNESLLSVSNGSLISATATDEVEQSSVWNIVFNEKKNTYKISSLYPVKYVKATETSLQFVNSEQEATEFSITKEEDTYYISKGNKYVSVNNNGVLFSTEKNSLNILAATIKHTINVQESLILDAKAGTVEIPMTYFGFENVEYAANVDWVNTFEAKDGILTFNIGENGGYSRTAVITLSDGGNLKKEIAVTQRASTGTLLYATLDINNDLLENFQNGAWKSGETFNYTQDNSASWVIKCGASRSCMEMLKGDEYYIKLPELASDIKSIKVFTKMGTKLIFEGENTKEQEIISNGTNEVETLVTFGTNDKPAILKVASKTQITKIVVDAREPLGEPEITEQPAEGSFNLTWKKVTEAIAYDVTVGEIKAQVTEPKYTLEGEAGYYNVSVVAVADPNSLTNINSSAATEENVKFGTPTLKDPVLREGTVTDKSIAVVWDKIANAETYICKLGDKTQEVTTNEVEFNDLNPSQAYTISVQAKKTSLYNESSVVSISVKTLNMTLEHTGSSFDDAYTVTEAKYLITFGSNLTGKYVTGTVTEYEKDKQDSGKMTYIITDGKESMEITSNDLGDKAFAEGIELPLNKYVVVYYKSKTDTYLYSIDGQTSILTGIELADEKTTEYNYGDTFIKPVVYGLYRGKDKEPLSEGLTFKIGNQTIGTNALGTYGPGTKTVAVSYADKTAVYDINVTNYYLHRYDTNNAIKGTPGKGNTWTNTSGGIMSTLYDCVYITNDEKTGYPYVQTGVGSTGAPAFESTITTGPIDQTIKAVKITLTNWNETSAKPVEGELQIADNENFNNAQSIVFKKANLNTGKNDDGKNLPNMSLSKPELTIKLGNGEKGEKLYYRFKIDCPSNKYYRIPQIIFEVE